MPQHNWSALNASLREQAKGVRCYVESEFAPLRACLVGNPSAIYFPDPGIPEIANMLRDSSSSAFLEYVRKNKDRNLRDADPPAFDRMVDESDALARALREAGMRVIRNETGTTPEEIVEMNTGWGGGKFFSLFGQAAFEVVGHCMVSTWEVAGGRGQELVHRAATNEIMENDPEAVWLTMPFPPPDKTSRSPRPMLSPGDFRVMTDKTVIIGIGVADALHVYDRSKPRSSGDEYGAEILRRMLKPYGWKVETVYFDSRLTYHIDCLMLLVDEGLIGLPADGKRGLWTALPKPFDEWEVIDIPVEEQQMGVCNSEVLGGKRILLQQGAKKTILEIEKRGYTAVEVPYSTIYDTTHSGMHCSVASYWREK